VRDLIVTLLVFGSLPIVLWRPSLGVVLWCWISYMNPHRLTYGYAYDFQFAAVIGAVTLASLLFWKEPKRIPLTPLTVVWLMFVLWISLTTLFALIPNDANVEWMRTIKIQLMTFVTIMVMTTRERLNALVWIIVFSLGFFGIKGGIFALLTGGELMVFGPEGSFIAGNNSLAVALIMTVPLMRYLQLSSNSRLVRYGLTGAMLLSALAILASYSRGAFVAVIAMALFLFFKSRKKGMIALIAIVTIPVILSFMPEKWYERTQTIETYQEDKSLQGRQNAWGFAYNIAKERPLIGGGFAVFDPNLFLRYAPDPEDFHDSHSIYFEVLGEQGFVGLGLFLALGFLTLRSATWIIQQVKQREDLRWAGDLAAMVQVGLVGYAVGGAFLGLAYFDLYYHLIAMIVLTRLIVERSLASEPVGHAAGQAEIPAEEPVSGAG
jgi:putative inorganic carbon (HCO3(-)) transporter